MDPFFQIVKDRGEPLHGVIHIYLSFFFVFGLGMCTNVQISWEFMLFKDFSSLLFENLFLQISLFYFL